MNHIDEKTLELYVLESESKGTRGKEIGQHLKECAGCLAMYNEVLEYYTDVAEVREERTKAASQALTVRSMLVQTPPFAEHGPVGQRRMTMPAKFVFFVVRHPIVSSFGFAGLFAGMLFLAVPKDAARDVNPAYARAKEEFLVAFNKGGEELWRKHIGKDYERLINVDDQEEQGISTFDTDGDGRNEIVAIYNFNDNGQFDRGRVVCYNDNGNERWRYDIRRTMRFGTQSFADNFLTQRVIVGDFDRNGQSDVVVSVRNNPDWLSGLIRLDARNGTLLDEYWHPGWFHDLAHRDIDGDGIEEIFVAGENNAFDRPSLLVLDPRNVRGYAPATQEYAVHDIQGGMEKYYLLLPRPDLQEVATRPRGKAGGITFNEDGSSEVRSAEYLGFLAYETLFRFDNTMTCVRVDVSDEFRTFHLRMEQEGKLSKTVDERYLEDLRLGVEYWNGEKFVSKPTMNQKYAETMKGQRLP